MSEMVERVALAISGGNDPASILDIHRTRARAAIETMRKPTSEMVRFGETAGYQDIGQKLSQVDGRRFAAASYQAMIGAALT